MPKSRSLSNYLAAFSLMIAFAISAVAADPGTQLIGKWEITTPARDPSGTVCPFVPDKMEFFSDGTVTMSNMPGNRVPFKTNITPEEKQAMEMRDPALKGKTLLLVKPAPQMEWRSTPMVYSYSVAKNKLTLTVTGWTPAKFTRAK